MTLPEQPFEALNRELQTPAVDVDGAVRTQIAKEAYLNAIQALGGLSTGINDSQLKMLAVIAVDAADILLSRLAGKRK